MSQLHRRMHSPGKSGHGGRTPPLPFTPHPAPRTSPHSSPPPHPSSHSSHSSTHSRSPERTARHRSGSPVRHDEQHLVPIRKLLFRPLLQLPAKVSDAKPSINKAAQRHHLHTRGVRVVDLPQFDTPGLIRQADFLAFIDSVHAPKVPDFPQMARYLAREADVAGSYLTNVLNPAVAILQTMIDHRYHPFVKIVVAAQYEAFPEDVEEGQSNSKLDDIVTLQKWPLTEAEIASGTPTYKDILFIIEYKRRGLVNKGDWRANLIETSDSRARRLLAQLILYARNFGCETFVFADYHTSVTVKVDVEEALDPHATIDVGAVDCGDLIRHDVHDHHPANPILALVWIGVVALDKLGILRRDIRGDKPGQRPVDPQLQKYIGPHLLVTGRAEPHSGTRTPSHRRGSSSSAGEHVSSSPVDALMHRMSLKDRHEEDERHSRPGGHSRSRSRSRH